MNKYNKFIWELSQEPEDEQFTVRGKILAEFKKIEAELLDCLKSKKPISRQLLKYRNKLNKLLANIPPFSIEEYDFYEKYEGAQQ